MSALASPSRRTFPPGPFGLKASATMRGAQARPLETFVTLRETYGDVVRTGLGGPLTYYLVFNPAGAEHVLAHHHKNYRKGAVNAQFRVLDGEGLVTSEGDFWVRQRRLAQPAFHRQRLEGLGAIMASAAVGLAARWELAAHESRVFDVEPELMRVTLEVAGRTLFGVDLSEEARHLSPAVDVARDYITWRMFRPYLPSWLPTPRHQAFLKARKTLDEVVYGIIRDRRRTGADPGDLLSMLMAARDEETGEGMTDLQLRDEVMTLLMAGHESTAVALTWAVYLLASHSEVQVRIQEEVTEVLGSRTVTSGDLPRLPYTRAVFEETLRLYPPAWALSRQAIQEDEICGYRIPAGGYVTLSPYVTQRHPDLWPDPNRFDPTRFLGEPPANRPRYAYFPFGGGPRKCIGLQFALMEAQIMLATLIQRFELHLASPEFPGTEALLSLRPKQGVLVRLRERKQ